MNKIRVLGTNFYFGPGQPSELLSRWAYCDFQNREILYAEYIDSAAMREAVFHELIHAADISTATSDNEMAEDQVQRISAVLFGILRDHPWLVDWLMEEK